MENIISFMPLFLYSKEPYKRPDITAVTDSGSIGALPLKIQPIKSPASAAIAAGTGPKNIPTDAMAINAKLILIYSVGLKEYISNRIKTAIKIPVRAIQRTFFSSAAELLKLDRKFFIDIPP